MPIKINSNYSIYFVAENFSVFKNDDMHGTTLILNVCTLLLSTCFNSVNADVVFNAVNINFHIVI